MTLRPLLICLWLIAPAALAAEYETDGWPGEGVPVLAAEHDVLVLHREPSKAAPTDRLPFRKGGRVAWDESRMITHRSVTLTAIAEITDYWCVGAPKPDAAIQAGEQVEHLQYRAEGYITARYRGRICEVFVMDKQARFDGLDQQPEVEWWLRVIDADHRPRGWLLMDQSQARVIGRRF